MIPFPNKKYQIIYADPPWNLHGINKKGIVTSRDSPNNPKYNHLGQYKAMSYDDIKSLPIKALADNNCVLFLWVVDNSLPFVFDIINSWGFVYKTVAFTWVKITTTGKDVFGMGQWTRNNPETCLLATKGMPKRVGFGVRQLQKHGIREHSRKPDEIRNEIVSLCGNVPRIELFARQKIPGWDVWGNEV
jgi:N6-adenosine-specific RNA methylase IME4